MVDNLVSIEEARALIITDLNDPQLNAVITRVESMITEIMGDPQNDAGTVEITEIDSGLTTSLYLNQKILSITSITEDGNLVDSDNYRVWPDLGMVEKLPSGSTWGEVITTVYKPKNNTDERKDAIIDITRAHVSRTAFKSESIAGEYNYSAIAWDEETRLILNRIVFKPV